MENNQNPEAAEAAVVPAVVAAPVAEAVEAEEIPYDQTADYQEQVRQAIRERGKKDMLYGALWCVGGLALTFAHIGFIFWGAIVFGAIQFFRGVSTYSQA